MNPGNQRLMFIWASVTFFSSWNLYFKQGMSILIITWKMMKMVYFQQFHDHSMDLNFYLCWHISLLYFVFRFCILYFPFVFCISLFILYFIFCILYFVFHLWYFVFLFCISSKAGEANSWHNLPLMVNWLKGLHLTSMKRDDVKKQQIKGFHLTSIKREVKKEKMKKDQT